MKKGKKIRRGLAVQSNAVAFAFLAIASSACADDVLDDIMPQGAGEPVSEQQLGATSTAGPTTLGDLSFQISNSTQSSSVQDNVVNSELTGNNTISGGAFANADGFGTTVIQNTGNAVVIQNATLLNVHLE